jgi:CheY-like chemotaxis protein
MVAVSDSGAGMSAEVKEHVFEPFFTTKPKGQGTGLGLATVYGVVTQSGGSVEVYSEPGQGSTFKIYLPRVDAAVDSARQPEAGTGQGTETLVLVEDDARVRAVALETLQRHGYAVHAFAQGPAALAAVPGLPRRPALLVTDVVLGAMNGGELAQRMQQLVPGIKVLFASGYTENVIVRHGVLKAGVEFVAKPYTPQVLARKVRQVLDGAGS